MSSERQHLITGLCHAALERHPSDRASFLRDACADDEALRREVESLLGYEAAGTGFLEPPALAELARVMTGTAEPRSDLSGRRLGGFQIEGLLGSGGMGDVYQARDVTLGR